MLKFWWLLLVIPISGGAIDPLQNERSLEYLVKAVFLYNFTHFVEWPAESFITDDAPFVIGVLGDDPFGEYLDETVQGEKVKNHLLNVQRYDDVGQVSACHILFISLADEKRLDDVLRRLPAKHILTVSDMDQFLRKGGMIRFFTQNGKIQIRINVNATRSAGLTISSKLLRVAEIF